jgi:hypothetical protein
VHARQASEETGETDDLGISVAAFAFGVGEGDHCNGSKTVSV